MCGTARVLGCSEQVDVSEAPDNKGADSMYLASALCDLGSMHMEQGNNEEAASYLRQGKEMVARLIQ